MSLPDYSVGYTLNGLPLHVGNAGIRWPRGASSIIVEDVIPADFASVTEAERCLVTRELVVFRERTQRWLRGARGLVRLIDVTCGVGRETTVNFEILIEKQWFRQRTRRKAARPRL